ncbi:MAG: hypothetical protein U5L96_10905 [Owenweeksia sp.]|nr:hypothetical protein [Owenweeksia sp.]
MINRPNVNFKKLMIMLVLNIIGDVVMIKTGYGVIGVASVTTFIVVVGIIYGFYMHRERVPFKLGQLTKGFFIQTRSLLKEVKIIKA